MSSVSATTVARETDAINEQADRTPWVARASRHPFSANHAIEIVGGSGASPDVSSMSRQVEVVFDGRLYNRAELAQQVAGPAETLGDADLVLRAYERWGRDFPKHIAGRFAIVVADSANARVMAVRDPLGAYPLFYAEAQDRLLFSTSILALQGQPGVHGRLNRAALADHLCHLWTDADQTFVDRIRRVRAGHMLTAGTTGVTSDRYWEPVADSGPVNWIADEDHQSAFEARFGVAVERALDHGPTGIFLSGGLDSISIAALAADASRQTGRAAPIALSLGFPGDADEETEQRGVARSLGLDHRFVDFYDAVPSKRLLSEALAISRHQPAPLLNTWMPAYTDLAVRAKASGVRAILSGNGGDEWLGVSPFLAADLIRARDVAACWQLLSGWRRSFVTAPHRLVHIILWEFGVRPLTSAAFERMAPQAWRANRVWRNVRRLPKWIAPDPHLRKELASRIERALPPANPPRSFYFRDVRRTLEHPLLAMELEEIFEMGRRLDVRFLHPYWDAGVVDILYRTRPLLLLNGGRTKSVVRATMARRFPGLGLDRQKKRGGTNFFKSVVEREVPLLWRADNGLSALADCGIVEPRAAAAGVDHAVSSMNSRQLLRAWDLIHAENWLRAHS